MFPRFPFKVCNISGMLWLKFLWIVSGNLQTLLEMICPFAAIVETVLATGNNLKLIRGKEKRNDEKQMLLISASWFLCSLSETRGKMQSNQSKWRQVNSSGKALSSYMDVTCSKTWQIKQESHFFSCKENNPTTINLDPTLGENQSYPLSNAGKSARAIISL